MRWRTPTGTEPDHTPTHRPRLYANNSSRVKTRERLLFHGTGHSNGGAVPGATGRALPLEGATSRAGVDRGAVGPMAVAAGRSSP